MSRPQTKIALINFSNENFKKLKDFINTLSLTEQNKVFPEGTMNRNIRDVLAHLHHWHLMFLNWHTIGMCGNNPPMPAHGYSWKETPALNNWIQEKYQNTDLETAKQLLNESFIEIQKIIADHTSEELFEKKRYKWTGVTSLGAYLVSATSSHYDWALKLIKKVKK
jgi:hypothetical protein